MLTLPRGKLVKIVGLVVVVSVAVAGMFFLPLLHQPVVHSSAMPIAAPQEQHVLAGVPVSLMIPGIGVDAPVDQMGIMPNGDMEAPTGAVHTGWYKLGPHPGNVGSAVIAGHFGRWKNGDPSVFDNLHTLKPGDKVMIRDDAGATTTFVVRASRTFGRDDDAKTIFTSNDGKAHLNLITCQGKWNESRKTYSDRLVVFTDKQ
jgi:LPXTG-site transpeptidase (sortase) family protein